MVNKAERKKNEEDLLELERKVTLEKEWTDKCPECDGAVKEVWVSPDGKTRAFKCVKGHRKRGVKKHPVWLVRS